MPPIKKEDRGGRVPYGYTRFKDIDRRKNSFVTEIRVNHPLRQIINSIFVWHREGQTLNWIAGRLNGLRQETPQGGQKWYSRTVKVILDNEPYYRGDYDIGNTKGFPRILD